MKINYKKIITVSLLLLSIQQCFALAPDQHNEQSQQELQNLEFPQNSTEQYLYVVSSTKQPAGEDVIIEPVVISDKIVGNYFNNGKTRTLVTQETRDGKIITTTETWKTKNSSYLTVRNGAIVVGTAAVVALTYMAIVEMKNIERIDNLKIKLYRFNLNDRNYELLAALTQNFSDEQLAQLIAEIKQKAQEVGSYDDIKMTDVVNVYKNMQVHNKIPNHTRTSNSVSRYLDALCVNTFGRTAWFCKQSASDHEAGHALVMALSKGQATNHQYATIKATRGSGGHVAAEQDPSIPVNFRSAMGMSLAGGIAMDIMAGRDTEKFSDFSAYSKWLYGMGGAGSENSDLHKVYLAAEIQVNIINAMKNLSTTQKQQAMEILKKEKSLYEAWKTYGDILPEGKQQGIDFIVEDAYQHVKKMLLDNKDKLAQMSNELYEKDILSEMEIYDIAGTTKPTQEKSSTWSWLWY
ncbi:MAG: hypothetical protein Q8Q60_05170 [Candidatus Chromulinivorax sp.]|nr:hypothetical protein [Candidatus Chromulinivorax sp.]